AVRRITRGLAQAAGVPEERYPIVTIADESASATYNDPELTRRLDKTFRTWLGEDRTTKTKPTMGAEDFGLFSRTEEKVPSCMFWLGTVDPETFKDHQRTGKPLPPLHSSQFRPVPEPTIKTGVTAMTAAVLELMAGPKP
ncbi:MAG: hypothetical protein L0Z50_31360, partial [Verrucomicrobiales bacterium]|nr:hypothetical protein [Verrucomicrobiales bacterium]